MNISGPTITFIMNRFVELFGNNSDIIYPEGFRHLENFELYKGVFPDRTPKDYQDECKLYSEYIIYTVYYIYNI